MSATSITLLIDLKSWLWAYLQSPSPADSVVNTVKAVRDRYSARAVVCGDSPTGRTFRHALVSDYKPGPDIIAAHKMATLDLLRADSIEYLHAIDFEGVDVIASLAGSGKVIIASCARICRQLLEPGRVTILQRMKADSPEWYTADTLHAETGLRPDQWVDYLALVGKSASGINGARGIGDKTARELLQQYGSFDNLVSESGRLRPSWAESIRELAARMEIVRALVTLRRDALQCGHAWQCQLEHGELVCRCPLHRQGRLVYSTVPGEPEDRIVRWIRRVIASQGWFDPSRDLETAAG